MATLTQLFTLKVTTHRADRKYGPLVYLLASPTVFVLAVRRFSDLGVLEGDLFLGLLLTIVVALLLAMCGAVLLEDHQPEPTIKTALGRAPRSKAAQFFFFMLSPITLVLMVLKLGELRLAEVQLLMGVLAALAFSLLILLFGLLLSPATQPVAPVSAD